MKIQSFNTDLVFDAKQIQTKVIIENESSKEIRIVLAKGQRMKEHKAPFPILIHVLEGDIDFGFEKQVLEMKTGDIITLEANVSHDLLAKTNSVIRLSLSKLDKVSRILDVINQ